MIPSVELYENSANPIFNDLNLDDLTRAVGNCLKDVLELPEGPEHVLSQLDTIEISIVDDEVIGDIHQRFLNDPTPTDVITFPHGEGVGEIIVSIDTAQRQSKELSQPILQELFRYMVHGLLHLHGYLDALPEERQLMFSYQEPLVFKHGGKFTAK